MQLHHVAAQWHKPQTGSRLAAMYRWATRQPNGTLAQLWAAMGMRRPYTRLRCLYTINQRLATYQHVQLALQTAHQRLTARQHIRAGLASYLQANPTAFGGTHTGGK